MGANTSGTSTSTAITCCGSQFNPFPANYWVLATSFISGGGSDTYTEDGAFTFLGQTGAGSWPTIRVAYKLTTSLALVSDNLTDGTARTWISNFNMAR